MGIQGNDSCHIIRFLRRNGVYLALVVSLMAVAAVVIAGLTRELSRDESSKSQNAQQQVEQKVTGQKDTRITTSASTTSSVKTTQTAADEEGPTLYLLPMTNTVQKPFSSEGPLFCETMGDWRLHLGVDFAGEEGQAVKAVTSGEVVKVEEDPLWGGVIVIDHGLEVYTRYCGVKSIVRVGDMVEAGQHIGDLQAIPCECAQKPHLHLEMFVDGDTIDPVAAIALDVRYADTLD